MKNRNVKRFLRSALSVFLCALLLCWGIPLSAVSADVPDAEKLKAKAYTQEELEQFADVTGDGAVGLQDYMLVRLHILEKQPIEDSVFIQTVFDRLYQEALDQLTGVVN